MTEHLRVGLHTLSPNSYNTQGADLYYSSINPEYVRYAGPEYPGVKAVEAALGGVVLGEVDEAVIAMSNTITGRVEKHLKVLMRYVKNNGLYVPGYIPVEVDHVLAVIDSTVELKDIYRTISHPAANEQTVETREELSELIGHELMEDESEDTARAAEIVRESADKSLAAITSVEAAEKNGLHIIQRKFYDGKQNETTFLVVRKKNSSTDNEQINDERSDRSIVELMTGDQVGALHDALGALKDNGVGMIDLDHIQANGSKHFVILLNGGAQQDNVNRAIEDMRTVSNGVNIIGSMRRHY